MRHRLLTFFVFVAAALMAATLSAAESPQSILSKADSIRNPDEAFSMKVEVQSAGEDTRVFDVQTKGRDRTIIRTVVPTRDKGRDLLMVEENMWAFVPSLKRAMRVSLSQKISGEAANGDLSRMRWAGDYDAVLETETPAEWVLFLTARKKGLTYEKIRARVEKKTFRPVSAEYLTAAGKPLKLARFGDYKTLAGKERPSTVAIQDAVRPDKKSTIRIVDMTVKHIPDSQFTLERFQAR